MQFSQEHANTKEIDYFEDGDMTEYTKHNPGSSTVQGSVFKSDKRAHGSSFAPNDPDRALEMNPSGFDDVSFVSVPGGSTPDLRNYPSVGGQYGWWMRAGSGDDFISGHFGWQNTNKISNGSGYAAVLDLDGGEIQVARLDNGTTTILGSETASLDADRWYKINVTWFSDGMIVVVVDTVQTTDTSDDVATIIVTDSTYGTDGLAWFMKGNDSVSYVDHAVVQ